VGEKREWPSTNKKKEGRRKKKVARSGKGEDRSAIGGALSEREKRMNRQLFIKWRRINWEEPKECCFERKKLLWKSNSHSKTLDILRRKKEGNPGPKRVVDEFT